MCLFWACSSTCVGLTVMSGLVRWTDFSFYAKADEMTRKGVPNPESHLDSCVEHIVLSRSHRLSCPDSCMRTGCRVHITLTIMSVNSDEMTRVLVLEDDIVHGNGSI
jgi:hypothetical protein